MNPNWTSSENDPNHPEGFSQFHQLRLHNDWWYNCQERDHGWVIMYCPMGIYPDGGKRHTLEQAKILIESMTIGKAIEDRKRGQALVDQSQAVWDSFIQ